MKEIKINRGELFRCPKKVSEIRCVSGILYITYEYSGDIILEPGEESMVYKKKNVIVRAFKASIISVN